MAFKQSPQVFSASIQAVTVGTGAHSIILGGSNVLPLYSFDKPIENKPRIGIEITDAGYDTKIAGIAEFYKGAGSIGEIAKKAAAAQGADFLAINLEGADPNGADKSIEECVSICKEAADAVDIPLAVIGSKSTEKDGKLFEKLADALQGRNVMFLSAKEENYKVVSASVGLAYSQKTVAESSVDINLAKQLNVMISQMGVKSENMLMNIGSAAAGYGFEYVASTLDRVRLAALDQNDTMLQMPIITPVSSEVWGVKESVASQEDFPEWGPAEQRGISMEITTAAACLASGSDAVILKHPESVAAVAKLIDELV